MLVTRYAATYFDGKTPRRLELALVVTTNGLRLVFPDGRTELWPYEDLRQTQGAYAGEELRFEHGLAAVVVGDRGILEAMHELAPASDRRVRPAIGGWRMLRAALVAVAGLAVGGWGLYNYGLPALSSAMTALVPVSWEEQLGEQAVGQVVPDSEHCADAVVTRGVQAVVDRLLAALPTTSPYTYKVTIKQDANFNAFALPGGHLVVTTGLLAKVRTPEELAGVLAHEIQHVERRHVTKAIFEDASTQLLIAGMLGNHDAFGHALHAAKVLGELGASRRAESEADQEGMKLVQAAHLDPQAMVAAYKHLEDPDVFSIGFLSTHPDTQARIAQLTVMAREARGPYQPIALPVAWARVKRGCTK